MPSTSTKGGRRNRTHYDNLKVARDAPPEVIRAAYRVLAQKYHPDRRSRDSNAAEVMKVVNKAYEVLSDPAQRQQHDKWIESLEKDDREHDTPRNDAPNEATTATQSKTTPAKPEPLDDYDIRWPFLAAGVFFMPYIFAWLTLRKQYSDLTRLIAFGWLILQLVLFEVLRIK